MKFALIAAVALAGPAPTAFTQTAPAPAATPAAATAPAKFSLDTPIEALVADAKARAVLDADLPGVASHPSYDMFKSMSLRAVQPMSGGKLTDEMLKKVEADLAGIK